MGGSEVFLGDVIRARSEHNSGVARRPVWLRTKLRAGPNFTDIRRITRERGLHTVCEEASCPNIFECWEAREATFLIFGDTCTRRCGFCDIATGKPRPLDSGEPERVAEAAAAMGLKYVVVTGVERDDVPATRVADLWAQTIRACHRRIDDCGVEVLTGDLKGDREAIATVVNAEPDVFAHNLETSRRLHPRVRQGFRYDRSLEVLRIAKQVHPGIPTKSNIIAGMGETIDEILEAMQDLRSAGVDLLTIGQYLSPSAKHLPVDRWVHPDEFEFLRVSGESMGFALVEAGPLVRSSYHAGKQYRAASARLAGRA